MAVKSRKRSKAAKGGKGRKRSTAKASTGGGSSKWAKYNTNSLERKLGTRKENRCQLCLTKVPLDEQYTVVNNLEKGSVTKKQNADSEANEHLSHYCGDCADKRVKRKEYWMESVRDGSGPDQRGQASTGRKRKKAPKKAKGKATRKRSAKKAADKPKRKRTRTKAKADKAAKPRKRARKRSKKAAETGGSDEPF
jgi:hypothetical protein